MSIQQLKSHIHQQVEAVDDETLLEMVNRILSVSAENELIEDFTDEQVAAINVAEEEIRQGNHVTLAEHKRKIEILSSSMEANSPDNLTDQQIAGIEKARGEYRHGKVMSVAEMKQKLDDQFPTVNF